MGERERVGELGIPIFKMDKNPMEPPGEEMPTYCLSSSALRRFTAFES